MELVAQGTANIASVLFGGIPATGAIARTVANVKNGGRTPVAGIIHSITLLIILVLFMPLAQYIPLATLSGILIVVSYNMCEIKEIKLLMKSPKSDILVLLVTFFVTVLIDLVVAIEIGMVLALFLFMKRMASISNIQIKSLDASEEDDITFDFEQSNKKFQTSKDILIYEINGPFFFGAADKFIDSISSINDQTKVIIIGLKYVPVMDATAIHGMRRLVNTCQKHSIKVFITGVKPQPKEVLKKSGLYDQIKEEHFFQTIEEAKEMYLKSISLQ
jgi:SulP family sulfate permease